MTALQRYVKGLPPRKRAPNGTQTLRVKIACYDLTHKNRALAMRILKTAAAQIRLL